MTILVGSSANIAGLKKSARNDESMTYEIADGGPVSK